MTSMRTPALATALSLSLLVAACADSRPATSGGPGVVSSGAHTAHLSGGPFANAYSCPTCHDSAFAVVFPPPSLARSNGATPVFDPTTKTCSNVYCHAGGPALTLAGGTLPVPVFDPPSTVACGACHGAPPPAPHTSNGNCGVCHDGYTATTVNKTLHMNGVLNVTSGACTDCHGDGARAATVQNPQLPAAPPKDTSGNTSTSAPGVGAHQAHLNDGTLRRAMACTECHVVPGDLAHATQPLQLTWGPLATTQGATPAFNPTSLTCSSTYCHGATLNAGGTLTNPVWTSGASQIACGSCHAAPPPAPHPQNASCGSCHPGYTATTVNVDLHVNGVVDLSTQTCTACHGDATRTASVLNPQLPAAPPMDTAGNTAATAPGVGTHQLHLNDNAMRGALACTECHTVPADASHATQPLQLTWGPLATTQGATPAFNPTSLTCSSTYCHGNFQFTAVVSTSYTISGNRTYGPVFNAPATQVCGSCHGSAAIATPVGHPALAATATNTTCSVCHPATVKSDGTIDVAGGKHIDGQAQALAAASHPAGWMIPGDPNFHAGPAGQALQGCMTCHAPTPPATVANVVCSTCHGTTWANAWVDATSCTMCHGTSGRTGGSAANPVNAAPPVGTYGHETDATRIGAHLAHLQSTLSPPVQCSECHVVPTTALSPGHANGPDATITFGTLARADGSNPTWNGASCSASYCHGSTTNGGSLKTPNWSGGASQAACGTCHSVATASLGGHHDSPSEHRVACSTCHGDGYSSSAVTGAAIATHVNGLPITIKPGNPPGWDPTRRGCTNSCHGNQFEGPW
jgi:predicted CxxxxCH...CXXCH cytochrome family protein